MDKYAIKYALPYYENLFTESDDIEIRAQVTRCQIFIEYRGNGKWCVCDRMGNNYSEDKHHHESMPSSRSSDFLQNFRFSKEEAFRIAVKRLPGLCEEFCDRPREIVKLCEERGMDPSIYFRIVELVNLGVKKVQNDFISSAE